MANLMTDKSTPNQSLVVPWRDISLCMDWLSQTYQTQFQIWDWCGQWSKLSPSRPESDSEMSLRTQDLIRELPKKTHYLVQDLTNGNALVILPVETLTHQGRIATGIVPKEVAQSIGPVIELFLESLKQSRKNTKQNNQLQNYASHAAIDFEELTWFRTHVDNLTFENCDHNLTEVARQGLESLKDLVQAESVSLIIRKQKGSNNRGKFEGIYTLGEPELEKEVVSELLRMAGPNSVCESFINNHVNQEEYNFSRDIHSVMIIPVMYRNQCFGWLIAVNRQRQQEFSEPVGNTSQEQCSQFGTRCALLMESAANVLATHAYNVQIFRDQQNFLIGTVRALVNAVDTKDKYTCGHSDRVAQLAKAIAIQHGLPDEKCQKIYLAGLLHDIGKIGVRDEVLSKVGNLSKQEYEEIKMHPVYGYEILKHLEQLQHVLPGVLFHHESWDGTGYPHGLEKNEIPVAARIIAVADAYDAMTSDRSYRKGLPKEKAEEILRNGRGSQWDPQIIDSLFSILDKAHKIISEKTSSFNMPMLNSEYVFEEELQTEDSIESAIFSTMSLEKSR